MKVFAWSVLVRIFSVDGSMVLFDGYGGPGSVGREGLQESVKALLAREMEGVETKLKASVEKAVVSMRQELLLMQKRVEEDSRRAIGEVEAAINGVRSDGALLRREVAEYGASLDDRLSIRLTESAAQEQLAREASLARVDSRMDTMAASFERRVAEADASLVDAKASSQKAIEALRDECAQKLAFSEAFDFAEKATNWSMNIEERLERSETILMATNGSIDTLVRGVSEYGKSAEAWTEEYQANQTKLWENLTLVEEFVEMAPEWSVRVESALSDLSDKASNFEIQLNVSTTKTVTDASAELAAVANQLRESSDLSTRNLAAQVATQVDSLRDEQAALRAELTDLADETARLLRESESALIAAEKNLAEDTARRSKECMDELFRVEDATRVAAMNHSSFAINALSWAYEIEANFATLSNATLSLEGALNATVDAVDAEVGARRVDSVQVQERIDDIDTRAQRASANMEARLDAVETEIASNLGAIKSDTLRLNSSIFNLEAGELRIADRLATTELGLNLTLSDALARLGIQFEEGIDETADHFANRTALLEANVTALMAQLAALAEWISLQDTTMNETITTWTSGFEARCSHAISTLNIDLAAVRDNTHFLVADCQETTARMFANLSLALESARLDVLNESAALSIALTQEVSLQGASLVQHAAEAIANRSSALEHRVIDAEANTSEVVASIARIDLALGDIVDACAVEAVAAARNLSLHFEELFRQSESTIRTEVEQSLNAASSRLDDKFAAANTVLNATMAVFGNALESVIFGARQGKLGVANP